MELFTVKPTVHLFERFADFAEAFTPGEKDLILTEKLIYELYIKPCGLSCRVVLKDEYDAGEPKEEVIDAILLDIRDFKAERVIAVGGGSVIDIAKLLVVKDAYPISRVMNREVPRLPDKELIILPTTCGTGSEVTFGGIVTMKDTGLKTGIMDPTLSANHAVLVPELISSLPLKVFMHCSTDALGHAMEAYVSATRGNEFARATGARAISLILNGYALIAERGEAAQKELSADFITASCLAGMAVNNGGAGPVHALAYPLGEVYKMPHGESIYQFLSEVFKFYERKKGGELLSELSVLIRKAAAKAGIEGDDSAFAQLERLMNEVYPSRRLSAAGMKESDIEPFVKSIFESKQRLLKASYCEFTEEDAAEIYRARL